ncbi:FtsK/SpoIIIE domain-containing protein [Frankia sp. Cj3]|uniref:FtsK/SpoIIIE domain-containing protein n=1 Tax=Frankia sp. Cj3 TaxID=2880976 RepID=UPI001EF4AE77|nr:FtsK/SpoIIIE domain-containing protein [Frankia sp. Cj3]
MAVVEGGPWGVGHGAADPWPLTVAGVAVASALRYYAASDHAKGNREMRRIGAALVQCGLVQQSGQAPRMKDLVRTPAGKRVDIRVPRRSAALVFEKLAPVLEDELEAEVRFEQIPAPKFGLVHAIRRMFGWRPRAKADGTDSGPVKALIPRGGVRMTLVERDTLAKPLTSTWPVLVPGADGKIPMRSYFDPIPVAQDEDGEIVTVSLANRTFLIGGESRSGKSVATHLITSAAILDPRTRLALWDGKGELELADYMQIADGIAGPDPAAAVALMKKVRAELEDRLAWLGARGLKKATPDCGLDPLLLVIEEFTAYTKVSEFLDDLTYVMVRCLAAQMGLILTTQRPSSKVVPTDIRDNLNTRWAFRVNTNSSSDMILSEGWAASGFSAKHIQDDGQHRGVSLLLHEGSSPKRVRTWYEGDDMPARVMARALELRGMEPKARLNVAAMLDVRGRPSLTKSSAPALPAPHIPERSGPVAEPDPATSTRPPRPGSRRRRLHQVPQSGAESEREGR